MTEAIFQSSKMAETLRLTDKAAGSHAPVFIVGPSGVGKELIVNLLHEKSPRFSEPLIKINCAALPRELIESELFGSIKGAFTGAFTDRQGLFQRAGAGTLFLDEITEMPFETQSKLLRVVQENEVRKVGSSETYRPKCRVIAASNRNLRTAIKEHKLREDLYYRLNVIEICVPALDERPEDIPVLARHFINRFKQTENRPELTISDEAILHMTKQKWPGNVRQLQNELYRAVLTCDSGTILPHDLTRHIDDVSSPESEPFFGLKAMERETILETLRAVNGNKVQAAKRLGIGRQTLYNKIKAYEISCL
jgi:two-component system, NtrC family, response regulator AtoC